MQIRSRCLHSADKSQVVLDIATKLYTLDVILEHSLFSTAIKLYSLDVILSTVKLEYVGKKLVPSIQQTKQLDFD